MSKKTSGSCTYNVSGNTNQVVTEEESSGTGFVVAADGVIGTCAHVVEGAKRIEVHLGGQTYPATVVAVDPRSDVALIKINGSNLPTLTLSDSDTVQLAEAVRHRFSVVRCIRDRREGHDGNSCRSYPE